jgi:hypothetical protein
LHSWFRMILKVAILVQCYDTGCMAMAIVLIGRLHVFILETIPVS